MRGFLFVFGLFYAGWIAEAAILYSEDFSKIKVGSVPDTMLVLGGKFEVRMEGKESFLRRYYIYDEIQLPILCSLFVPILCTQIIRTLYC